MSYPKNITNFSNFDKLKKFLETGNYKYIREQFVSEKVVGRNEPCPCNSGLKFKKCCGR